LTACKPFPAPERLVRPAGPLALSGRLAYSALILCAGFAAAFSIATRGPLCLALLALDRGRRLPPDTADDARCCWEDCRETAGRVLDTGSERFAD
jgi:hypothetical protein